MGINASVFLGMLLCGYIGEKIDWHYGFGLAGVFKFFGMLQCYFGRKIFGISLEEPGTHTQAELDALKGGFEEKTAPHIVKDRLIVVAVLMIASMFFFITFEQAAGSM